MQDTKTEIDGASLGGHATPALEINSVSTASHYTNFVRRLRNHLSREYIKRRLPRDDFSIVSDDCWGGRVYAELGLKCFSPFIGMGFVPSEYLSFLVRMREPGALDVLSISSEERGYPIIQTRYARLMGMHYKSNDEFQSRYERRCKLIKWDRLFVKIDLGKPQYEQIDIERWNDLKLPHALALYPADQPRFRSLAIHQGVAVTGWELDGARQFQLSVRNFDVFSWLNHDRIQLPPVYRGLQFLLMERFFRERCRGIFHRKAHPAHDAQKPVV
jgi:uncharacterized protein (DUF1919 family)